MGMFGSTFEHQDFGMFKKKLLGVWIGSMRLEGVNVETRLPGSGKEPDATAIKLLKELPNRFPALKKEIEKHLYEHYEPYKEAADAGQEVWPVGGKFPKIGSPSEVWKSTKPIRVIVESTNPGSKLEVAFEVGWDEEHTVAATIENWKTTDFCGSV